MNDLAFFWNELLPKSEDRTKPAGHRRFYCQKVLNLLAKRHPDLYSGKRGATLSAEEASELVEVLKKSSPGHILKHRLSFLASGLERGTQELGWDVAIPQPPVVIPRDKPRFTSEDFQDLPILYEVQSLFLANLNNEAPDTPSARMGQLLLSAILFGGLVQKRWLTPCIEALSSPHCQGSKLWLDMIFTSEHVDREKKASRKKFAKNRNPKIKPTWEIHRRWFADPLTQILIIRWFERFPDDRNPVHRPSPLLAIRHYLERILPQPARIDDEMITGLLAVAATRLGITVSPFLTAFAEGRVKSVSLPAAVWERILTGKRVIGTDPPEPTDDSQPLDEMLSLQSPNEVASPTVQDQLLRKLLGEILPKKPNKKLIPSEVRTELETFFKENHNRMCSTLACLIHWGINLLTHYNRQELPRSRKKLALRVTSVRTYLETIGKKFISVVRCSDLLTLESDELHDIYSEIVERCPTEKSKHNVGCRLAAFHEFLVIRCGVQPVDFSDITVTAGPAELGVDANLITLIEFDRVKKGLVPKLDKASRVQKMQFLIAILGFRCGLRRSEARKLRLRDFQGYTEPELLIRNNRYGYVKSNESIRRVPLASLLEPDELALLRDWRRYRYLEDNGDIDNSLLFCEESEPTTLVNEKDVFSPIEQVLREVTGDPSLRFHHLRHSFASWLTLRLLRDFGLNERKLHSFLDHHLFSAQSCHDLRASLLGNHRLGRQGLYAVAQLCGHSTPAVTLLHYLHLCDWLLCQELSIECNQPSLEVETIRFLTGLQQHEVYYAGKTSGAKAWYLSTVLDRVPVPPQLIQDTISLPAYSSPLPEKTDIKRNAIPHWRRVEMVIRERQIAKLAFSELAARNGFSESQVITWCSTASAIKEMKTIHGGLRHVNGVSAKNNPPFPLPLRLDADKKMAENVIASYEKCGGAQRKILATGVSHFIENYCASEGGIAFPRHHHARKFIRFLAILGIPQQQIRVNFTMPRKTNMSSDSQRVLLAHQLGISENTIEIKKLHATEYSVRGELTVQILNPPVRKESPGRIQRCILTNIFDLASPLVSLNLPREIKYPVKSSNGFRVAMYMLAIVHSLPQSTTAS